MTQIECTSLKKAREGCLQYFTGISGNVFSFNYNNANGLMLSNTDYTICIRTERNFCGIQYSACPDISNSPDMSFSITGTYYYYIHINFFKNVQKKIDSYSSLTHLKINFCIICD